MPRVIARTFAGLAVAMLWSCAEQGPEIILTDPPPTPATSVHVTDPTTAVSEPLDSSAADTTLAEPVFGTWDPVTSNLVGLSSECGNLPYLSVRADRDQLIAGVALQGLWSSEDGSDEWVQLGQEPGSDVILNRLSSIVYDPDNLNTFWESGNYNGGGVFKTVDNGATFQQLGDVLHSDLVSVDLTDPERRTLLSGTHEQPKVFRSDDGGRTWDDVSADLPAGIGYAKSPYVIDPTTHLLGTSTGPEAGVFRTTDGGLTWIPVYQGGILGHPLVLDAGNTIHWLLEGGAGMITSTDQGLTWTASSAGVGIYTYAANLVALPDGRLATFGQDNLLITADGGQTWTTIGPKFPYTPAGLAYSQYRKAFYIWRFDCIQGADNPIPPDAIMRLNFPTA